MNKEEIVESVLDAMFSEIQFDLPAEFRPYIKEAIKIGAKRGYEAKEAEDKWISVKEQHPQHLEIVWLSDGGNFVALGCVVNSEDGYHWAQSNGLIYAENGKIVSECESDDLDIKFWQPLPNLPSTPKQ